MANLKDTWVGSFVFLKQILIQIILFFPFLIYHIFVGWIEGLLYQWEIFSTELTLYFQQVCIDPGFVLQRIHTSVSLSILQQDQTDPPQLT